MNYLMQINAFKKKRRFEPISSGSICLYYVLLEYANSLGFPKEFSAQNQLIAGLSGLSITKLQRNRGELIDKEYIRYKNGKKGESGKYEIIPLVFEERKVVEQHSEHNSEYNNEHNSEHNNATNPTTYNKYKINKYENKRILKIRETDWHDYDIELLEKMALKRSLED